MVAAANRIVNKHIRWHLVAIGAFLLMLFIVRLCRYSIFMQSSMGEKWYVPVIPSAAAFVLIVIYYAVGGAPMAAWVKLYNIQEVYLLLFIGLWEGCISIGLITSNTGYNILFERSHINAEIKSADGKTVYRSSGWSDTEGDPDYSHKTYSIRGKCHMERGYIRCKPHKQ